MTTKIEWEVLSIKTAVRKNKAIQKFILWFDFLFLHPLVNILVLFGAVTAYAGRNDISRGAIAAFGYRDNVIPCFSLVITIGAFSAKIFGNNILANCRNWVDSAFSTVGMLPSFVSVVLVVFISLAIRDISAWFTKTVIDFTTLKPLLTSATVRKSFLEHYFSFVMGWFFAVDNSALNTFCIKAIPPARIAMKHGFRFPCFTFSAIFQSAINVFHIFVKSNSDSFRGSFFRTNFITHVPPVLAHSIIA